MSKMDFLIKYLWLKAFYNIAPNDDIVSNNAYQMFYMVLKIVYVPWEASNAYFSR